MTDKLLHWKPPLPFYHGLGWAISLKGRGNEEGKIFFNTFSLNFRKFGIQVFQIFQLAGELEKEAAKVRAECLSDHFA